MEGSPMRRTGTTTITRLSSPTTTTTTTTDTHKLGGVRGLFPSATAATHTISVPSLVGGILEHVLLSGSLDDPRSTLCLQRIAIAVRVRLRKRARAQQHEPLPPPPLRFVCGGGDRASYPRRDRRVRVLRSRVRRRSRQRRSPFPVSAVSREHQQQHQHQHPQPQELEPAQPQGVGRPSIGGSLPRSRRATQQPPILDRGGRRVRNDPRWPGR
mmetsp:Transcript_29050/g.60749  ORF Transcript_29050/g.60749 Transcript_29050/m.60749 type:complete len:213 (-) Transcript_29050:1617-2255(-)